MRNVLVRVITLLWMLILPLSTFAEVAQPTPLPNTFVHDFAGVISDEKKVEIQAQAQQLKDQYQTEIAVVTINSLEGEESFDYSMRMARSWGIGSKDNNIRGLLILVSIKDRKIAFRTSRHIEGELPDGVTGEISRQMNTYFKKGDFGGGLSTGMGRILERLKVAYQPQPVATQTPKSDSGLGWLWLPVIGLLPVGVGYAILRRRRKKRRESPRLRQDTAAAGGFRAWASSVDPSKTPKVKSKTPSNTKPTASHSSKKSRRSSKKSSSPAHSLRHSRSDDSSSSRSSSSYSSYDSGSSSSDDSGSSYSGGSDFGGGGSDSSW